MSDCDNIEIREWLPDYLHDQLDASARASVREHLASCADCAAELALLRSVRVALAGSPAVNVASVVRALPKPPVRRRELNVRFKGSFTLLQLAAVLSFISIGGISLAVARSYFGGEERAALIADSTVQRDSAIPGGAGVSGISFGGGIGDLADEALESLMSAVESIEALPSAEPTELPVGGIGGIGS